MNNPYQAPEGQIVNTESTQHEYAGFWLRTGQAIIDTILFMVVLLPLMFVLPASENPMDFGLVDFVPTIVSGLIYIGFWAWKGQTPAKMLFKTKIIDEKTGEKPTVGKAVLRYIGYIIASLPIGLGLMWVGWDKKKQGWHDKIAGTVVIKQ